TTKLMKEHPDAWFTKALQKPLSAYNISIPLACERSTRYITSKVNQLHDKGRSLQVKLAFRDDGSIAPIPIYNSDNAWFPKNLNETVHRSDSDDRAPGEAIVCRHFAWAYAKKVFGRGKETFKRIDDSEKVLKTFENTAPFPYESAHFHQYQFVDRSMTHSSSFADGYYFLEGKFSEAIEGLVKKYWNMSAGDEKNFYFRTSLGDVKAVGHAMALRLKKQDECMKVIFYDPNATLMHRTFLLSEPDLAAQITGEDLQASFFSHGALINIDDWKKFSEECDVQFFGAPAHVMRNHIRIAPGHYDDPERVQWQLGADI
ncbi:MULTISPECIES: hypothetical protein, partial [unclassified Endozoicomonas]